MKKTYMNPSLEVVKIARGCKDSSSTGAGWFYNRCGNWYQV